MSRLHGTGEVCQVVSLAAARSLEMIAESDDHGEHLVRGIKTKLSVVLSEFEAGEVIFSLSEYGHAAGDVVLQAGFSIQAQFRAGLGSFKSRLSSVELCKKEPGTKCHVRLES